MGTKDKAGNRWAEGSPANARWSGNPWGEVMRGSADDKADTTTESPDKIPFDYIADKTGRMVEQRPGKGTSRLIYRKGNGTEIPLSLHDPHLDLDILSRKKLREKILITITDGNINAMMRHGKWEGLMGERPTPAVFLSSKGGTMDYAVYYLHATFGHSRNEMLDIRNADYEAWDNLSGFVWFLDHGTKAYNVHDAGNLLWGHTMEHLGYSLDRSLEYANKNEQGQDASADQRAIQEGHGLKIKTTLVQPGDLYINAFEDTYYEPDSPIPEKQPMLLRRAMKFDKMPYDL